MEIKLPKVIAFFDTAEFHNQFKAAIAISTNVIIDAEDVERITTPALQVLISAKKTIEDADGSLFLKQDCPVIDDALSILGLETINVKQT